MDDTSIRVLAGVAAALVALYGLTAGEWNRNRLRRKGIARVLADDMRRAQSAVVRCYRRGAYKPSLFLEPRIDRDGQERIATAARPNEWATISSALGWLEVVRARAHAPTKPDEETPPSEQGSTEPDTKDGDSATTSTDEHEYPFGSTSDERKREEEFLVELYERLDAARWSLRRLTAPLPWRLPVAGITRTRWRPHGIDGLLRTEPAAAGHDDERSQTQQKEVASAFPTLSPRSSVGVATAE
ncbi:hypothetical protein GKE82_24370 [Conexibacter sp. W3-3-2]|uniref:hypothetical protein n=1 Tax=Conexibacter sp. W3-3-2 TaxID=2675227 RepID=UPI0012B9C3F3|nr:hypothetical protein [Conexibacter sp. W3-3-2]MTD47345.1 hypothetical protein [Conexibacter sp. W3-3-2]